MKSFVDKERLANDDDTFYAEDLDQWQVISPYLKQQKNGASVRPQVEKFPTTPRMLSEQL